MAAREVRLTHQVSALRRDHAEFNRSLVSENRKGTVSQFGLEFSRFLLQALAEPDRLGLITRALP